MSPSIETLVRTESVRITRYRKSYGTCLKLSESIKDEGLRHPLVLWGDGTLVSGERRLFAHMLLERDRVPATFVNTVEDAAKLLLADNQDDYLATPMKWSEICRLWGVLRRLDAPAAASRADEARRRGVALRRQTQAGTRKAGRASHRTDDYLLGVVAEPFGISSATARRVEVVYQTGLGVIAAPDEKRELARQLMAELDAGASVWATYQRLLGHNPSTAGRPRTLVVDPESASSAKQQQAWEKALPLLEGTVAGLLELGRPNPDLTWSQIGPVHARLSVVRREIEKMIKHMKETSRS